MKLKPADTWFSKCVRHAANWTCEKCGKQYAPDDARGLDCSHIFGRKNRSVRWCGGGAVTNAIALCMGCHRWWHENPSESGVWIREHLGEGAYSLLEEKKNQIAKISKAEEKEISAHYRKEYRRMVSQNETDFQSWQ